MRRVDLPDDVLQRRALIYVRQSTGAQVQDNRESQRRQYELADLARTYHSLGGTQPADISSVNRR